MKKLVLFLMSLTLVLNSSAQTNITFKANLPYPNDALSNIGGYVDSLGNEYALVGYESGLSIVDVTNPANPIEIFTVPGTPSTWREVKTMDNYAYVTTEGCCNGLQIVNLGYLPDSVQVKQWTGGPALNDQLETIHALHVDGGHAYLYGCNLYNGALFSGLWGNVWYKDITIFKSGLSLELVKAYTQRTIDTTTKLTLMNAIFDFKISNL